MKTFRVVENPTPRYVEKYDEFIRLYNESDLTVSEIKLELDWTASVYNQAKEKALSENRLNVRNPNYKKRIYNSSKPKKPKYYSKNTYGKYVVVKRFYKGDNQTENLYYGTYKYEWQARRIVEELKKVNWDVNCLEDIRKKVVYDDK